MKKREVIETAWTEADPGIPFSLIVSVPHGARLPPYLQEAVRLHVGPGLPTPVSLTMTEDGITSRMSFGRTPFDCVIPWASIVAVLTEAWSVRWTVGEAPAPSTPRLRVV